jgi:peptidoglycan/LPS O-acetylase OafA/YrhL
MSYWLKLGMGMIVFRPVNSDQRSAFLSYRSDINGLLAAAVLLVVLNHLRTAKITGGFIGVDTFFVISVTALLSTCCADRKNREIVLPLTFFSQRWCVTST